MLTPARPLPGVSPADRGLVQELTAENVRLKRLLQMMELDWLRALHNAIPPEEANALRESVWLTPVIEVSWENPEAAPEEERRWVREAVEATWQAESGLQFTNWGKARRDSRYSHQGRRRGPPLQATREQARWLKGWDGAEFYI